MSRTVVVTGSNKGLGLAMVKHFIAQGDRVFGLSRSDATFQHPHYSHSKVDISDYQAVGAFFRELRQKVQQLDILINNAGIASMNAFALTKPEKIEQIFQVNVCGTSVCCQKALGLLRKSPEPRIINLSTVAVPLLLEGEAVYAASKSAVETITKILAKEYGFFGITCNAIGPSPIQTALIQNVPKEKINKLIESQAIKKMANETDVINVIDFFIKPESRMISGQVIYLGGISA